MAIAYLQTLRDSIEKLSEWESTREAFGFIENVPDTNPDYIYEFYCAMRILDDLSNNHIIEIKPGVEGYKFPQNPGKKVNFAKFLIKNRDTRRVLFQFCLGVNIQLSASPLTTFGADISIHTSRSNDVPDESDIVLIMDAKYKQSKNTKLDISIIREFAQCIKDMKVPKDEIINLKFNRLMDLKGNCLITNGEGSLNHEQYCKNNTLKQVTRFDCDGRAMKVIG